MAKFSSLTAGIGSGVYCFGHPSKFQPASRLGFVTAAIDVAHRRPTKLCTMFGHLLRWYTIYTFWGLLPPDGILPGAKFTLRPSRAFSYIASVTARHCTSGRQTRHGITELSQRPPPVFGWAAITLGIGPHSSSLTIFIIG